jgi:hypothetical protein
MNKYDIWRLYFKYPITISILYDCVKHIKGQLIQFNIDQKNMIYIIDEHFSLIDYYVHKCDEIFKTFPSWYVIRDMLIRQHHLLNDLMVINIIITISIIIIHD